MNFWIDVENASGVKQGEGPIISAESWQSVARLDRAGSFAFSMPASDVRAGVIQPKLIARCYTRIKDDIVEIGAGIIDKIGLKVGAQGQAVLEVSGDDLMRELTNRSVGFLELTDGAGNGVTDALAQVMAYAPSGWALDDGNGYTSTLSNVYAKFAGETVLSALVKIANARGEHFRLGAGRKIVWMRKDLTASGIRAVQGGEPTALDQNKDACIVLDMQEERDTYEICSRMYPYGNGVGEARLTLAATNRSAPAGYVLDKINNYLLRSDTETVYGRIDKYMSFKDVSPVSNTDADLQAAANMLFDAAYEYLNKHYRAEKFYNLAVTKVERVLKPGETIRLVVRRVVDGYDAVNIDADLTILEVTNRIDAGGLRTVGMKVASVDRWNDTDDSVIISRMEETRVMESYPQMNANSYVTNYMDYMDDTYDCRFDFWLGPEVVNVNQVMMRFTIESLRSTVKSVAGQSTTSSSGGGSTPTSSSASTHTHTVTISAHTHGISMPNHTHNLNLYNADSGNTVKYSATYGLNVSGGGSTPVEITLISLTATASGGSSTPTSAAGGSHSHTVSISAHTHTLTPSITTVYGIYEEPNPSSNKLRQTDLTFDINGTEIPNDEATPVDGWAGWWELDLTSYVSDATTFRPLRTVNRLTIGAAASGAGRKAQITGQLVVRTVIRAVAVV